MTYYGAKELADSFRTVRKNTILTAEDIPESQYGYRVAPETRSVAELLIHLSNTSTMTERFHGKDALSTFEGFDFMTAFSQMLAKEKEPRTKAQIVDSLRTEGERIGAWLGTLKDDFLAQRVTLPTGATPPSKTRFEMLLGMKEHEMHHRGQLMLIERMIGIVPHLTRDMQARIAQMNQAKANA